ncbi:HPr-like protein Crh [bacterium BMS3Abin05]|nr:HPr-like protein Crh [bacterium BMS3Abin05]GBE26299.1 HPr-like protein Crh [bacterium BMS3Bbin03]HDK36187.1 HPr family phosphocarrier protein [Bacteroidota bacterium]HDL78322.1 HPr family phosphocarrier protein [Bacteroidota bacterium]HDL78396.1 HPr family phosphocarrier protein [Bacteroidota bacterium]
MVEKEVTVINKLGLHARPSALFVRNAAKFKSEITLVKDGVEVNGKSIMGLMMLAAEMGSKIKIRAEGEDEKKALEKLSALFENKFDED